MPEADIYLSELTTPEVSTESIPQFDPHTEITPQEWQFMVRESANIPMKFSPYNIVDAIQSILERESYLKAENIFLLARERGQEIPQQISEANLQAIATSIRHHPHENNGLLHKALLIFAPKKLIGLSRDNTIATDNIREILLSKRLNKNGISTILNGLFWHAHANPDILTQLTWDDDTWQPLQEQLELPEIKEKITGSLNPQKYKGPDRLHNYNEHIDIASFNEWLQHLLTLQIVFPGKIRELSCFPDIIHQLREGFDLARKDMRWNDMTAYAKYLMLFTAQGIRVSQDGWQIIHYSGDMARILQPVPVEYD